MLMVSAGADPELFVAEKGVISSAIGRIGGTKEQPRSLGDEVYIQEDNVLAEFNIKPSSSAEEFSVNIRNALEKVLQECAKVGLEIKFDSSNEFSPEQLNAFGPKALEFGCDPDYNAYTGDINPAPEARTGLRTAGGHVHIGYFGNMSEEYNRAIIRACDLLLGVPSVLMDNDTRRRELYGKAGAYRSKNYGVEYRTLSNFWIKQDATRRWVFKQAARAVRIADYVNLLTAGDSDNIQECINTSNKPLARMLVAKYNLELV